MTSAENTASPVAAALAPQQPTHVVSAAVAAPQPQAQPLPIARALVPRPVPQPVAAPVPAQLTSPRHTAALALPQPPPSTPPLPRHRITAGRVVCWELAAALVLTSLGESWPVLTAASAGALVLVGTTTIRVRGRLLHEIAATGLGYLTRSRGRDLPEHEKTLALLDFVLPGATRIQLDDVLAISHPAGLTALVAPQSERIDPAWLVPGADFAVRAVHHAGGGAVRHFLAVHVARTVDVPRDEELKVLLRNGVRRTVRSLKRAGTAAEPVPVDAGLAAIAALAHITGGRTEVREDWRFWRTGPVVQAGFRLTGWDRLATHQTDALLAHILRRSAPAAATVTVTAPGNHAVLRLAATTEAAVTQAAQNAEHHAATFGVRLDRLDGAHRDGVAASLPIGGFSR